ncbi:PREDICTED: beta-glucosidase 11-like isoform X1 [Nicotiana attenuata]|uniref:Beta-glucosidase 11 n=2 Tax=Nicotiana attenuata TaxID=49451 RepID=A0A1J6KQB8_NICAT|nr:PREDICTED: beta-glucosidase 11-like isoform X1 [Nicotiana attenuata]OIT21353.1 beta-glucosidase 11 [Nicotiana attenuata]
MQRLDLPMMLVLVALHFAVVVFGAGDDDFSRNDFPASFVFGSGSSAYQVEGAAFEDGRTPSIWDTFSHAGAYNGANGDVACDAYHKYKEDVQLMVDTGLEAYRFSISWSRLIPNGRGPVNPKGLQYYNNLINELVGHGIQPHVTLCHYDVPQVLEDEYGGWLSEKIINDFIAYADVCFKEFGDRVLHWTTVNEANVFALGGYDLGFTPPGRCSPHVGIGPCSRGNSSTKPYIVAHSMLLTHSSVFRLYKRKYKSTQHGFVGLNIFAYRFIPHTNATADEGATLRAYAFYLGWFISPLIFGDYPVTMKDRVGSRMPTFTRQESEQVKGAIDFIGLNHYATLHVKDRPSAFERDFRDFNTDAAIQLVFEQGGVTPKGEYPWTQPGLQAVLEYFKKTYGNLPIYIHENGQTTPRNATLNDMGRVEYLHAYIRNLLDAMRNGSNVRGYFSWSFLDGMELLDAYESAYGLYYVDLDDKNLTRYPKLSQHWYSNFLKGKSRKSSVNLEIGKEVSHSSESEFSS